MPYVDEKDLLSLHSQIEKEQRANNRLLDQVRSKNKELAVSKSSKKFLQLLSIVFAVAFFGLSSICLLFPELIASTTVLESIENTNNKMATDGNLGMMSALNCDDLKDSINYLQGKIQALQNEIQISSGITSTTLDGQENKGNTINNKTSGDDVSEENSSYSYDKHKKVYTDKLKSSGVLYSVQIKAFKKGKESVKLASDNFVNFREYPRKNEYFAYSVGNFKTRLEANELKEALKKMGISDAFIVEYKY